MLGINKAFLEIRGIRFIDRVSAILRDLFNDILIVTKDATPYKGKDLKVVKDILDIHSPLSGIHAGLTNMTSGYAFCIGCDTPFLKEEVVKILVNEIEQAVEIIVPFSGIYYQPLCAVYSKRCIPLIEKQLMSGDMKVDNLFKSFRVKTIPYEIFKRVDEQLLSFFNVNSPADLEYAEQLLADSLGNKELDQKGE